MPSFGAEIALPFVNVSLALCGHIRTELAFLLRGVLFQACLVAALLLPG
jgi:hypothetical protein